VFEGSSYAGDTRVLDVQPNEERLVSYAIDLGTEVNTKTGDNTTRLNKVWAKKGIIYTESIRREEKIYEVANRSTQDRTLLIEHANRSGQQFKIVSKDLPKETAADVYRFEYQVPAGKSESFCVVEERTEGANVTLSNSTDDQIRYFIQLKEISPALKSKLGEALTIKGKWDATRREIATVQNRINTITQDQQRLRLNLRETPKEAEAYQRYLKKLDDQEKEMDTLHAKLKDLQTQEHKDHVAYENYLSNLTIE
jgi:hypothetical protein